MPDADCHGRLADSRRLRPAADVVVEHVGDEVVLNDQGHGRIHVLNATAGRVWELCGEHLTVAEIAERLATGYGLTADAVRDDVDAVLRDLVDRAVVADTPSPAQP